MSRLLRALAPAVALFTVLALAAPAQAAFPGRSGVLVVTPVRGGGLILVGPRGAGQHRICTDSRLCGTPVAARFSPTGGDIVFLDGRTGRVAVVDTDGTCMWCLLGAPLSTKRGGTPAFTGDGQSVSLSSSGALWRIGLGGGAARVAAGAAQATWSAGGMLAYVRAGWIWVAPRGRGAHRLTPGAAPDFSPDGRQLVFARAGALWLIPISGGSPRRLVRGGAPAFSPDGRQVAFVGAGGHVYVISVPRGGPRLVPGVRGRSVSWQPVPRGHAPRCPVPPGGRIIARNSEAVITQVPATPFTPWYGCLVATGRRYRLLTLPQAGNGYSATLDQLRLAGRFTAVAVTTSDRLGNCSHFVTRTDLSNGSADQLYIQNCTASDRSTDSLGLDASGFAGWHAFEQVATSQPLLGISCPSAGLCVAVDGHGNVASTNSPTGGAAAWSVSKVASALNRVSCAPGTTFCVAVNGGSVMSSSNPGGGPSAWSAPVSVDTAPIADISCPSTLLCVGVDSAGNVLTSNSPITGAWNVKPEVPGNFLTGVSCPSVSLCVAVGQGGDVLTTHDPIDGASATWSYTNAEPGVFALGGVSCPSSTLCVATDSSAHVLSTTHTGPAGAGPWSAVAVPGAAATSMPRQPACVPGSTVCVAPDGDGGVMVSSSPTTSWSVTHLVATPDAILSVACAPGSSLCTATDQNGSVFSSTNPTGGAGAWQNAPVDAQPCGACIAEQVFAQDDRGRQAIDSVQPGPGNVLGGVALSGNSLLLTWSHAGRREAFGLF